MIEFITLDCLAPKIDKEAIRVWLEKISEEEKKQIKNLVYVFCSDTYLLKKNIKYLNHNNLTDVITFDYCEEKLVSGDVLISIDRVKENAVKFNVSFLTELYRIMAHGLLHLLGYKDKTNKQKEIMQKKEDYYLKKIVS